MKMILAAAILALSAPAFAQTKKMSPPPAVRPVATSSSMYSTIPENEITAGLGMIGGAINLSATYIKPNPDFGFGGYFFLQSSKEKGGAPIVSQIMAFGALIKLNVIDTHKVRFYVAPGVGFTMIKDGSMSVNAVTGETKKSDENIIGPTFKMGVQIKTAPNFMIGLERMQYSNWLNDSLSGYAGPSEYYQVACTFDF